jgi:hypothetical protein
MSRVVSAAAIKGASGAANARRRPDPNTRIGAVYDYFRSRPATPIHPRSLDLNWREWSNLIEYLRQYGLDIRRHSRGYYWLVGEETDNGYVDHIAERVT